MSVIPTVWVTVAFGLAPGILRGGSGSDVPPPARQRAAVSAAPERIGRFMRPPAAFCGRLEKCYGRPRSRVSGQLAVGSWQLAGDRRRGPGGEGAGGRG